MSKASELVNHNPEVKAEVREFLQSLEPPCKTWWKAKYVGDYVDAPTNSIGKSMSVIHQEEDSVIVDKRMATGVGLYRVQLDV